MTARTSMANTILDSTLYSAATASSPLRRKSILSQTLIVSSALSENDDEAERLARRREITDVSTPLSAINTNDRRRSLGLGFLVNMPVSQMAERISQCIKLGTTNKINPKNAFSLELIDFMTYMIKKKDANMSNLKVASTSLDVSTKIYGYRVDGVHMDILKMAGGLDKPGKDGENQNNEQEIDLLEGAEDNKDKKKQDKKRKKKNKQRIFTTVEALKASVETEKPSVLSMEADLQTTDMLYQVLLPNHANSKFYQHPYNDILVDTVDCTNTESDYAICDIPKIADISNLEICPPLFYFDFLSWNADDEPEEKTPEKHNESRFQFDLDASLPHEDEHVSTGINYFDIEEGEEENIDRCAMVPTEVENIVDFRQVLTKTLPSKVSEYTFIQKNINLHWAGSSHWKVTNFRKVLSNSRVVETCRQAPMRKKKEIEICYDDEMIERVDAKFLPSQSAKLHARTAKIEWNEEALTLPPDKHYDILQANKLYLHRTIFKHPENEDDVNATSLSDDVENYNYANEHDTSDYCPDVCNRDHHELEEREVMDNGMQPEEEGILGSQMPFTGENLVAIPKLTNKLSIAYSVRPKKIDMRQLKQSIWKCLKNTNPESIKQTEVEKSIQQDVENRMNESKHFSDIYKKLPNILTKTNVEALSFPISFVSLLHLANEKTLKISSVSDMADLIVEQG